MDEYDDQFTSVQWERDAPPVSPPHPAQQPQSQSQPQPSTSEPRPPAPDVLLDTNHFLNVRVVRPTIELEGTKEQYVAYEVVAKTNLPVYPTTTTSARRRFQDFRFLRHHLAKDFPACVVPPLPDKHRMEYLTGDRFSQEFIERRRLDLERFVQRVARHPTLQRSKLLIAFLSSTEWNIEMHQHIAHPPHPDPPSLIDNISDTLLNAFARVRKPDERFSEVREGIDRFEDGLGGVERLVGRVKARVSDLSGDYDDQATSVQNLGYLESGITEPLNRFAHAQLEFGALLKQQAIDTLEPALDHLHSLLAYAQAHRAVLKLRDQKQLDFEELSAYLSSITLERDRLAALQAGSVSSSGLGLGSYIRDRVDHLRGTDDDRHRRERLRKMDVKIKELQEAVEGAADTSNAFSDEVLREHAIFNMAKRVEMRELLGGIADGHIEMYRKAIEQYDRAIPNLERIRVDL